MFILLNKDMVSVHSVVRAYVEDDVTKVVVRCEDLTSPSYCSSVTTPLFSNGGFKTIVVKSSVEEVMKAVNDELVRERNM